MLSNQVTSRQKKKKSLTTVVRPHLM